MAIIHRTTMSPGKLELLAAWLPAQPWYPYGTDLRIQAAGPDGTQGGQLMVRIHRALRPGDTADGALQPYLWAPWRLPDGPPARGVLASAQYRQHPTARSKPQRRAAPAG
jgi:hypothetical protein